MPIIKILMESILCIYIFSFNYLLIILVSSIYVQLFAAFKGINITILSSEKSDRCIGFIMS